MLLLRLMTNTRQVRRYAHDFAVATILIPIVYRCQQITVNNRDHNLDATYQDRYSFRSCIRYLLVLLDLDLISPVASLT